MEAIRAARPWQVRAVADRAAVGLLIAAAQAETWWPGELSGPRGVAAAGAAAMTVPLLWRRQAPLAAGLVVFGAWPVQAAAGVALDDRLHVLVSVLLAMYATGAHAPGPAAAAAGLLVGVAGVVGAEALAGAGAPSAEDLFFVAVTIGVPWGLGRAAARRQARAEHFAAVAEELERRRDDDARRAAAEERERIARELHDVVAHSVSLMLVQATGGRRRLRDGDHASAAAALASIETIGRAALADLRRAIGLVRAAGDTDGMAPQPGLAALPALADRARAAGVEVRVDVRGRARPLAPGLDLAAYRIVQEAVTNVAKHARGAQAEVAVTFGARELEVAVRNGPGDASGEADAGAGPLPGGHGLIGVRERVGAYGGRLEAGPDADGGFRLRARLPIEEGVRA